MKLTETQARQKILIYIKNRTNHRRAISIEKEAPPLPPDTENPPIWYEVTAETIRGERVKIYFSINDGNLIFAKFENKKYHICDIVPINKIF